MTRRYLTDRRKRNQELARLDAAHRCTLCKRSFAEVPAIIEDFLVTGKFCSDECLAQFRQQETRRPL